MSLSRYVHIKTARNVIIEDMLRSIIGKASMKTVSDEDSIYLYLVKPEWFTCDSDYCPSREKYISNVDFIYLLEIMNMGIPVTDELIDAFVDLKAHLRSYI